MFNHSLLISIQNGHFLRLLLQIAIAAAVTCAGNATEERISLYQTDFADFPPGDGQLVGHDGWSSTHPEEQVHGVIESFLGQENQAATLGLFIPVTDDDIISVFRPITYDPVESETPAIEFSSTVSIVDSIETEFFDSFYISVFNTNDDLLGSVVFDNTEENFGIWRSNGLEFFDTGVSFEHEVLYQLQIRINFAKNTWTATLDGMELFTDSQFSSSDAHRDLGDFSAEWEIADVLNPGDNWMMFDDWTVNAITTDLPVDPSPQSFLVTKITRRPNGSTAISWAAEPDARYQVLSSANLDQWESDLPNSLVTTSAADTEASFIDRTARSASIRYYRVHKLE